MVAFVSKYMKHRLVFRSSAFFHKSFYDFAYAIKKIGSDFIPFLTTLARNLTNELDCSGKFDKTSSESNRITNTRLIIKQIIFSIIC